MPSRRRQAPAALPAEWFEELTDASLRDMAGEAVFDRGLAYWREDRVELLRDDASSATFEARGSDTYEVELYFEDVGLHVDCTCPHAQDGNFCKHMVAAALVWRQALGGEAPNAPATKLTADPGVNRARMAKAAQTRASNHQALHEFLACQPAEQLAQRLLERSQSDRDLMAELKAWMASAGAADDPKALRKAVNELLKVSTRDHLERREVRAWTERAVKAAALLHNALPQHASEVRGAAESALRQAHGVDERAHEDPGEVDDAIDAMLQVLMDSLRASPPPAAWAEHLLQCMQRPDGHPWQHPGVLEAAGPAVAGGYSRRLAELWAQAQERLKAGAPLDTADMGIGGSNLRFDSARDQLRRWMIQDLQRQGDPQSVYEFMKRHARGVTEHAALIEWCNENGRPRDALAHAQAACKLFKHAPLVEDLLLAAYERDGWDDEVLLIRQRRFDQRPSPGTYADLIPAARAAKADVQAVRRKAFDAAMALEQTDLAQQRAVAAKYPSLAYRAAAPALNVSWRAGMLLLDDELDQALALVQPPHTCDPRVLEALADRLPVERNAAAFALMKRCFEFQLASSKSPYREPLRLLAKAVQRLNSQDARAYLVSVGHAHRAKRNFVAGLPRLIG